MKRILSIFILLCGIVSAYAQGDVIEIWTKADLEKVRDNVNNGTDTYEGDIVKLMADLDLGSWTSIGNVIEWDEVNNKYVPDMDCVFKGTFKGQGYTIDIDVTTSSTVLGLFGYFYGIVENLKVTGTVFNTEKDETSSTAGIVAYNKGIIRQCANLAEIQGTIAGGIAGENNGTITNCYHVGTIDATSGWGGEYFLGGIAGKVKGTTISNVYASCDRMDKVSSTGGIVATNQDGTLTNCYYNVQLDGSIEMDGSTTLTGNTLKGVFDNSIWTFAAGKLPELTCFVNKIVRLSDNNDNSAILTSYNGQKRTVELSGRTLYKDGAWNTLCLPFDLTLSGSVLDGDGVVAKVLNGTNTSLNAAGLLSLTFNDAPTTIPAGTPFIIKWESGTDLSNVQFSNVTLDKTAPTPVKFSTVCQFVGTYSPFSIGDTSNGTYDGDINEIILLSSDNTLGYSKNPRTLRSCRAHFMIPTSAGIRAMLDFDIDFDNEEVTAIANLKSQISSLKPESWFTLQGVKLDSKPTQRGIYLHNGRKEAIR